MKTPHTQSKRRQTISQAEIKNHGFFTTALGALLLFIAMAAPALAVDSIWNTSVVSPVWSNGGNWNTGIAPLNAGDTATFNTSNGTSLLLGSVTGFVTIDSMTFNSGASAFTIHTDGNSFSFVGVGIVNRSVNTQTIHNDSGGTTSFLKNSTAANATIINSNSGTGGAGMTNFRGASTAGNATITNGDPLVGGGGSTTFNDTSNAGNATITNNGGIVSFDPGGSTTFKDTSKAGNATLIANGGPFPAFGGTISFEDDSTGDTARVKVFGNGELDISGHNAPGVTVGSIEGDGNVLLGANNLTVGSNNLSTLFSGVISGTGNLTKVGTGTQILGGSNSYTGTTFVNDGTLTLVSGVLTTNHVIIGPLIIGDDVGAPKTATVIDTQQQQQPPQPKIANSAPVTVNSDGLFEVDVGDGNPLSGIGEGVGPLVINRGNVRVEGSLLPGHLEMNGGSISGAGTIVLPDLTATSDASGNAATISANAKLADFSKVLTVNDGPGSTDLRISGVIFQETVPVGIRLGITKEGTGTLVLSGANTYTGTTVVNDGSLFVDGSIRSAQTLVNAGGLLGGNGSLGGNGNLLNSGIVSPGHSPGTLTIGGNYTQTTGGTLRIEIAPGQFDLLRVGGHASLAGTLQLVRLGNFQLQVGDKITFLMAGEVSGSFDTVQNPFISNTLVKAQINIFDGVVQLEGTQGPFTEAACNPNTLAVAKALDSAVGDPRASGLIDFLDMQPLSELCGDLELIAPDELPAIFNFGVSLANIQTVNLERRMDDIRAGSSGFSARGFSIDSRAPDFSPGLAGPTGPEGKSGPSVMQPTPQNPWGVFVTGLGEFTDVDSTSTAPGYNFSTGGLTFGVDYRVSPNFAIGLSGGYAHTNADLVNNGSLDVNGGTVGAYATGFAGGFYADAAAFGVFNGFDEHRTALLGTASGDTDGRDFNALVAAGYDWKSGGLTIGPTVSYQYTYVEFDGFTEHGSLAPLTYNDQNAESSRTALGAKASYDWHVGHVVVKPELRAAWQHEFGDTDYSIVSRFASGAGSSFTVNGPAIGRDSLLIGAGAAVLLNDRVSVYAYYDGELARTNYSSNNVSAGVRVTF